MEVLVILGLISIAIVLVSTLVKLIKIVAGFIGKVSLNIAKSPVKGIRGVIGAIRASISRKADRKLDKALLEADTQARLNAARLNSNYKTYPAVAKIEAKKAIKAKRAELKAMKKAK